MQKFGLEPWVFIYLSIRPSLHIGAAYMQVNAAVHLFKTYIRNKKRKNVALPTKSSRNNKKGGRKCMNLHL